MSALELFHSLPPTFLLSTPVENSEATWKKAKKCNKKHYKNVRNPYRKDEERCVEKLLSDARFSSSLAKKTGLAQWSSLKSKPKMANNLNWRNLVIDRAPKTSFVTFA